MAGETTTDGAMLVVDVVLAEVVAVTATVSTTFAMVAGTIVSSDLVDSCACFTGEMFLLVLPAELINAIALANGTFTLVLAAGLVVDAAVAVVAVVSNGLISAVPSPFTVPFSNAPARSATKLPFRPLTAFGEPSFSNLAFLRSAAAAARLIRSSLTRSLYISSLGCSHTLSPLSILKK